MTLRCLHNGIVNNTPATIEHTFFRCYVFYQLALIEFPNG